MFDNLIHIHENIGANNIMNNGLKDWKKVVFISYPNKDRSTFLAVNDFFFALLLAGFMNGFTDGEDDYCIIQVWENGESLLCFTIKLYTLSHHRHRSSH